MASDKLTIDSPNDKSELAKDKVRAHRPGPLPMIRAHDRGANAHPINQTMSNQRDCLEQWVPWKRRPIEP